MGESERASELAREKEGEREGKRLRKRKRERETPRVTEATRRDRSLSERMRRRYDGRRRDEVARSRWGF